MNDRNCCYPPDFTVLRNRPGIRAAPALEAATRGLVAQRFLEPLPTGNFGLSHLKAIHRHLFQDVYIWAGMVRTVEIAEDGSWFQPRRFIETGMADIHRRIGDGNYAATSRWPSMTKAHRARPLGVLTSRSPNACRLEQL